MFELVCPKLKKKNLHWSNCKIEENWLGSAGYKKWLRILLDLVPQIWQWFQAFFLLPVANFHQE